MNELLQNFVESLREELKQYGELLALLDLQQEKVIQRMADELVATVSAVNTQGEAIRAARLERAQRQRELAQALGFAPEASIGSMIPSLPDSYQPLVEALVDENNHLLSRVRQRARQNQMLLNRAVELMGNFIHSICAIGTPTYNQAGAVAVPAVAGRALYEGIC